MLPKFRGKVKCIYIDPPYNTSCFGDQARGAVEKIGAEKVDSSFLPRIYVSLSLEPDREGLEVSMK